MREQFDDKLLILSMLLFSMLVGCFSCTPNNLPPKRIFSTRDLLIDDSVFPDIWEKETEAQEWPYETIPNTVLENLYVEFKGSDSRAIHSIYRFANEKDASNGFSYDWFPDADRISSWESPEGMSIDSLLAEQFMLKCADFEGGFPKTKSTLCIAIGQYDEYISEFTMWTVPPELMNEEKAVLQQVLISIEDRLSNYFTAE
jgi:hypothetical protein